MRRFTLFSGHRRAVPAAIAGGLYVLSLLVPLWLIGTGAISPRWGVPAEWGPFVMVLTDRSAKDAERLLLRAGASEVVTEDTSEVFVTRFGHMDTLGLSRALETLDILDPRRDPFITGLPSYFPTLGDGRSLIYVRRQGSLFRAWRLVRRALGTGSALVDWQPSRPLVSLALWAVGAGLLIITQRRRAGVFPGLLPWAPLVLIAGIPGAVIGCLAPVAWQYDGAGGARILRSVWWRASVAVSSLLYAWATAGTAAALVALGGIAGLVAVTVGLAGLHLGVPRHSDHPLFSPIAILSARSPLHVPEFFGARRGVTLVAVAVLLISPPLVDALLVAHSPAVPRHAARAGVNDISYESVHALWENRRPGELVNVADYFAHRAYQEGLEYGWPYRPPDSGERLTLSRYRETADGAYEKYVETVRTFDRSWLEEAVTSAPRGIARMLLAGGTVSGVVESPTVGLYSGYPPLLIHAAYVFLALLLATLRGSRLRGVGRGRSKVVEIARRRKQVA